jgi:peroxiredoxin
MAVLVARVLLAGMFGISAFAKLADRRGAGQAVREFGVPVALGGAVASLLAWLELGVAVALLVGPSAAAASVAALVLLAGFSLVVTWTLRRGRHPACHCFGRLSSGPVGWSTVARNVAFTAVAAFVALEGRLGWLMTLLAVVAVASWVGPAARRRWIQRGGTRVASWSLPDPAGERWTLDRLLEPSRPLVLVFSQPACGGCDLLMPAVARWQAELQGQLTIAVVSGGSRAESSAKARRYGLRRLLVDDRQDIFRAYGVTATPSAVLIGNDRTVAAEPALGADEIERLVELASDPRGHPGITRRRVLERAVLGFASVSFVSLVGAVAAACGSSSTNRATSGTGARRKAVEVDGAWLCDQPYVLCTTAACQPSASDPNVAVCRCFVLNGYSIGFRSCPDRAPSGNSLVSTFSTQNVDPSFGAMTCPGEARWANCLDVTCQVDPANPGQAVCDCPIVNSGPSLTFGGGCQTGTCTSVIWSATAPPGVTQFTPAMKEAKQRVMFPRTCPSP